MIPGSDRKTDSEYVRNGTVRIVALIEPPGGVHHVSVREHRTAFDRAEEIKYPADVMYPDAERNTSGVKVNWHFRISDAKGLLFTADFDN